MSNDALRKPRLEGAGAMTRKPRMSNAQLLGRGDAYLPGSDLIGEYDHLPTITPVNANLAKPELV